MYRTYDVPRKDEVASEENKDGEGASKDKHTSGKRLSGAINDGRKNIQARVENQHRGSNVYDLALPSEEAHVKHNRD